MIVRYCKYTIINATWPQNKMRNLAKVAEFNEVDESGIRNVPEFCKVTD